MKILTPDVFEIEGSLVYNESLRSFCMIKLQKEVLKTFGILGVKDKQFGYKMQIVRSEDVLEKKAKEIADSRKPIPILLYLYEVEEIDNE